MDSDNQKYHEQAFHENEPAGDTLDDFAHVAKEDIGEFGRAIKVAVERVTGKDVDPNNPTTQASGYAKHQ
ncbi:hypothetical protein GCK32_001416 [Trichostrongylus colubriformis]|uniref:Uncharacterized protein n=1 Tax=Trichostrongylus colubriformis TaxID=6319 RepID=A0AAN8F8P6_TRICO